MTTKTSKKIGVGNWHAKFPVPDGFDTGHYQKLTAGSEKEGVTVDFTFGDTQSTLSAGQRKTVHIKNAPNVSVRFKPKSKGEARGLWVTHDDGTEWRIDRQNPRFDWAETEPTEVVVVNDPSSSFSVELIAEGLVLATVHAGRTQEVTLPSGNFREVYLRPLSQEPPPADERATGILCFNP